MMKRSNTMIMLAVLLVSLLAACGQREPTDQLEAIKQKGVIQVGTSADYPPFESVDSAGNLVGFDIDLMNEVARRMGVTVDWVDMPFDSLIAAVQEGKLDMAISAFNYSDERAQRIDFTEAYYTSEDSFMVLESFAGQINQPEDIANYLVGVQTGTTQDEWLTGLIDEGILSEANLSRYDRVDQAALDLRAGRIEALMSDYVPAQELMKTMGGMKIVYVGVLSSGPMNMVVPKGSATLTAALNDVIRQLESEGFIDQLAIQHMGE
jgi:polar amino acid transport system substrate-binding protein